MINVKFYLVLEKDVLIKLLHQKKMILFVKKVKNVEVHVKDQNVNLLFLIIVKVFAQKIQNVKEKDVNQILIVIKMIVQKNALILKHVKMLLNIHVKNVKESFYVLEKIVLILQNQVIFVVINHVKFVKEKNVYSVLFLLSIHGF